MKRYQQLIQHKNKALQSKKNFVLPNIKMSKKTLKLDNIEVNKKEFRKSKQPIVLNLVDTNRIVLSDKFKHCDDSFKYFFGYKEDDIAKP